jgi:glycosyltransferase involved in cell wall biosynthesis
VALSVITPCLNEAESIEALVESLLNQSEVPTEIVIADGGSTDGTRQILDRLQAEHPPLRVIDGPGGRAENRNAAIAAASNEIVACIDAGCVAEPQWFAEISAPFATGADWVGGFYRPDGHNARSTAAGLVLMSVLEEVNPETFLPPGASQAFRKSMWEEVGRYPEGMDAAEDTLFGERARAAGYVPVFQPKAMVRWEPPKGLISMAQTALRWGRADGEAGLRGESYKRILLTYGGGLLATLVAFLVDWRLGVAALGALWYFAFSRSRKKLKWASGASRFLVVPLAHFIQHLSQATGWLLGRS